MLQYKDKLHIICKIFRVLIQKSVLDVAKEVGCSKDRIYAFERGKNDNMHVLLWYIDHGLNEEECKIIGGKIDA